MHSEDTTIKLISKAKNCRHRLHEAAVFHSDSRHWEGRVQLPIQRWCWVLNKQEVACNGICRAALKPISHHGCMHFPDLQYILLGISHFYELVIVTLMFCIILGGAEVGFYSWFVLTVLFIGLERKVGVCCVCVCNEVREVILIHLTTIKY